MKTQFLLFSAAMFFVNPGTFSSLPAKSSGQGSMTITQTQDAGFSFFRTHRQGRGVTATWGLTTNSGVAGFLVQRTYEDPADPYAFWEDVVSMPCNLARSFKYCDQNVFPGYINYRIVALMENGSSIISEVSGVRIVSH